jgi:hypothetical protein
VARYLWTVEDEAGRQRPAGEGFGTREEAEAWLGETWQALVEAGGRWVCLSEDGEVLYRMSLASEA